MQSPLVVKLLIVDVQINIEILNSIIQNVVYTSNERNRIRLSFDCITDLLPPSCARLNVFGFGKMENTFDQFQFRTEEDCLKST